MASLSTTCRWIFFSPRRPSPPLDWWGLVPFEAVPTPSGAEPPCPRLLPVCGVRSFLSPFCRVRAFPVTELRLLRSASRLPFSGAPRGFPRAVECLSFARSVGILAIPSSRRLRQRCIRLIVLTVHGPQPRDISLFQAAAYLLDQ